jgi:wyosine [tRNA(Phe)-imidazoG37] synthetase (radical SAM superfamily)
MTHKKEVFQALLKVEDNIQKLDSAFEETINLLDCPNKNFSLSKTVDQLASFQGKVIIQTLFVRGTYNDQTVDNTTEKEITAWIQLLEKIKPSQVMIYTIARDTPIDTLEKVSAKDLKAIAEKVENAGFNVQISA